jgi:hypothetical protein
MDQITKKPRLGRERKWALYTSPFVSMAFCDGFALLMCDASAWYCAGHGMEYCVPYLTYLSKLIEKIVDRRYSIDILRALR